MLSSIFQCFKTGTRPLGAFTCAQLSQHATHSSLRLHFTLFPSFSAIKLNSMSATDSVHSRWQGGGRMSNYTAPVWHSIDFYYSCLMVARDFCCSHRLYMYILYATYIHTYVSIYLLALHVWSTYIHIW